MILYEVNLKIKKEVGELFLKWLPGHMERVLKANGFFQASLFHEDREEEDALRLTVFYKVKTKKDLEFYFNGYTHNNNNNNNIIFPPPAYFLPTTL